MTKVYTKTADGPLMIEGVKDATLFTAMTDHQLAITILTDALEDAERARELHTRFMWRVIKTSPKGFRLSLDKVLAEVADIEKIHRETAMGRAMVAREPVPVVSDRGGGIVWDQDGFASSEK